jgi:AcrR family transcriptional regulator
MTGKLGLNISELKTRETPRQKRAQARVAKILHATAEALHKLQPHQVSTTIIAEIADIPVSSIYRYFKTVEDIFDELYAQTTVEIDARVLAVFDDPERYPTWRERHRAVYAELQRFRAEHPYYLRLLRSSILRTGLESVDPGMLTGVPAFLAARWDKGGDGFTGGDPVIVAQVTMQIFLAIENFVAARLPAHQADAYFEEIALNVESYLANYLSDDR